MSEDIRRCSPQFSIDEATEIAQRYYSLNNFLGNLSSERDQNFLFGNETSKFILKISNIDEEESTIEMQNQAMEWVQSTTKVIPTFEGKFILKYKNHFIRLMTFIPGIVMAHFCQPSDDFFVHLGTLIGQIDQRLSNFHHPAGKRYLYWDIQNARIIIEKYKHLILDEKSRLKVEQILNDWINDVIPQFPFLRMSMIHNDANDYNIIIDNTNEEKIHLIDFGDMCYTYTVSDVAITCAYAMLNKSNPIDIAKHIVQGYQQVYSLEQIEMKCLPYFILIRLSMSVTISAHQKSLQPDNKYLQISEKPAWNLLQQLQNKEDFTFSSFYTEFSQFLCQK